MRSRLVGTPIVALCALMALGLSVGVLGCSAPWTSSSSAKTGSQTVINQAIYQLQAALGLADGVISQSSQPPLLPNSDVALKWVGGRADVDLKTGHIRAVLVDISEKDVTSPTSTDTTAESTESTADTTETTAAGAKSGAAKTTTTVAAETTTTTTEETPSAVVLSDAQLDKEADRAVGLLGWDTAALETQGFTEAGAVTVEYRQVGRVYEKTWMGHDPEGVPNQGILQVGLDVRDGGLQSFLFAPGPETALEMTEAITRDAAIKTAVAAAAKTSFITVTTTAAETTTTTAAGAAKPASSSTTVKAGTTTTTASAESAMMMHINKPGITGGKDMLVWVVKLAADAKTGRVAATVYVDAVENKSLLVMAI